MPKTNINNSDENNNPDYGKDIGIIIDNYGHIPLRKILLMVLGLASFFAYYDITNYSYISPVLKAIWTIGDTEIAYGATMTLVGYVIGALSITVFADLYGRRLGLFLSILILGIGSILAAGAQDITQMYMFRMITGIGIGSEIALIGTYMAEMSPKAKRGRYTSTMTLFAWAGITLSGPISYMLLQQTEVLIPPLNLAIETWRIVLSLPGFLAFIILPIRTRIPESPRWLYSKGRIAEANSILSKSKVFPRQYPIASQQIPNSQSNKHTLKSTSKVLRELLNIKGNYVFRIIFLSSLWFFVLIPINASLLIVVAFVNEGYTLSDSISINMISSIGFILGGILSIFIADRLERKYQISIAGILMSIGFILRGILVSDYIGLLISGFVAFASNAWLISVLITYTSESFPTKRRSLATGIVEGIGRTLASIGPVVFVLLMQFGFLNTMVGIALFTLCAALIAIVFGHKSINKSLEELNKLS